MMKFFTKIQVLITSALAGLVLTGGVYSIVRAADIVISPNNIEPVELAADPLYAQGNGQKPTLTLALSVEYPTVGAQYRSTTFSISDKYLGYFDVNSCYSYNNDGQADNRYFQRIGTAINMQCAGNGFGGNFMNWATSSSIDLLRYGLTGGDRIIDTSSLTVLQRAVLQEYGINGSFWNASADFPQKILSNSDAKKVMPLTLLGNHNGNVYISNCLNNVFFSTTANNGNCASPLSSVSLGAQFGDSIPAAGSKILSAGMFYARVKVCEAGDPRINLCQKYPNGNSKPVGNMQKYSDRIRLAAFGYLNQPSNERYGGVLRAPMAFVGAKSYDADGNAIAGINQNMEWNIEDGVFKVNPLNQPEGNSGVINYLNKFGRTGSVPGTYKRFDPVGELYYESLRYLQGLQPTPQAVSGLTDAIKDGYPVYFNWTDPFANDINAAAANQKNYACLRNSILVIGDVNTHNDKSLPGNTRTGNYDFARPASIASNEPNFVDWTKVVGGFESGTAVSYLDGAGTKRDTSNPTDFKVSDFSNLQNMNTGADQAAYYMAGAAYWAHTHDIRGKDWTDVQKRRPGMRITTYVLDVNENNADGVWANRRRTQFYLAAKYGGFDDQSGIGNPFLPPDSTGGYDNHQWARNPSSAEPDPKTYFLSSDAQAVLDALDDIFIAATKVTNSIATPASTSGNLTSAKNYLYMASFDPAFWSGDVVKNYIKTDGNVVIQGGDTERLSAADRLDKTGASQRNIYVGKSSNTQSIAATIFFWDQIEPALKNALNNVSSTNAAGDGRGEDRLNFLRGDRSKEGIGFRKRSSRLGDIINSGVVFSGVPASNIPDADYSSFVAANASRVNAVFVGANDGMLHAFNADTMDELFAYIPSWLGGKLNTLTDVNYNSGLHTSYVDATPTVGDAKIGAGWKTVLISGTGGGGRGVFALDVTQPDSFNASNVLWEFSNRDDADLGNVVGAIKIMKVRTNPAAAGNPIYKWFAVVPSGVNNYVNDGYQSATGKPALFFLDLSKDAGSAWSLGTNYLKISFPFISTTASGTALIDSNGQLTGKTRATGVLNFTGTAAPDGAVRFLYVPDLHGQLWKIDMALANFSSSNAVDWNLAKTSVYNKNAGNPIPMFIAQTNEGKYQPISMSPTVAYGPSGSYIVAFGTGKYLEAKDNAINGVTLMQSFYALYDVNDQTSFEGTIVGRKKIQPSSVNNSGVTTLPFVWTKPGEKSLSISSGNPVSGAKKAGWYMDYPNSGSIMGERQVSNAVLFGKNIVFNSIMPPSASTSACSGGSSYTYTASIATGSVAISELINGAQGSPLVFRVSTNVTVSDSFGQRTQTDKVVLMSPSSSGDNKLVVGGSMQDSRTVGRLSWRQIDNYRDLRNKSW